MKKNNIFEISSDNVFADLGLPNPEERLAKAELAYKINSLVEQKDLTQTEAADLLGIDQPKVSLLKQGKLSGFSLERLFRFLMILGQDVTISVTKASPKKSSQLSVNSVKTKKTRVIKKPTTSSRTTGIRAQKKSK